ncbi:two-component sensor histidine kinase [Sphaerisporangium rufum]|uniref:histidine kinase n=1 Tax=Sphaerisporangium rufum TaxID=1381558 RepID=A0A919V0R6_9ACTN|nr:histidine kinase [Sphaerisporangium rufum]GII80366.1 two-component sensor histidine kinase [Sphaerisporangium rufum]
MKTGAAGVVKRHRDRIVDVMLAMAVLAFTVPTTLNGEHTGLLVPAPMWVEIASGVVAAAAMLVRRRAVWLMLAAATACAVLTTQTIPLTLAAYSMTAEGAVRRWPWPAAVMTAAYIAIDYVNPYTDRFLYLATIRGLTLVMLPAIVGTWVREYRHLVGELRAGVRVREEQAASRERRWIAAELHDTVTHAVTAMVLNAGIIQESAGRGEIGRLAAVIEDKGMRALAELRELLNVLHREEVHQSAAGVEAIPQLVRDAKSTGLRVALRIDVPEALLPRQVSHSLYRVVQEGLNNVRKHAPGARVRVECVASGEMINVLVVNGPAGQGLRRELPEQVPASGYGLAGLRERVSLAGGRLEAGCTADGGYALTASIPFRAVAPTG